MKPHYYIKFASYVSLLESRPASLATAQEAAEKLAIENPGESLEILKCVGIASCSKASTFWMDEEEPAADLREFEFYRNAASTVFWRVGKDSIEIGCDYGNEYTYPWERSQHTKQELERSKIRITADELPESLA
jgi:hypothetical protein